MKLVIDALGSDLGPVMVAEAVNLAMADYDFSAVLVGPQALLQERITADPQRVEYLDTEEFITNEEHPVFAIRRKKQASVVLGLQRMEEGDCDAFLSAGSTGALLAGGYFISKRMPGVERGCLAVTIPNPKGGSVLVDTGANMDTTPEILLQFAYLGSAYVESMRKIRPRVGLLNVGVEKAKGDKRAQATYALLEKSPLQFIGNVEARSLLTGSVDVVVCDGFAGNVALKTLEGTAGVLMQELKKGMLSNWKSKLGALLLKDTFKKVLAGYDYRAHGAAPLLGVKQRICKAHGNSSASTFALAIRDTIRYVESGASEHILEQIEGATHAD